MTLTRRTVLMAAALSGCVAGLFVSDVEVVEAKPVSGVSMKRVKVATLLGQAHDHRHAVEVGV